MSWADDVINCGLIYPYLDQDPWTVGLEQRNRMYNPFLNNYGAWVQSSLGQNQHFYPPPQSALPSPWNYSAEPWSAQPRPGRGNGHFEPGQGHGHFGPPPWFMHNNNKTPLLPTPPLFPPGFQPRRCNVEPTQSRRMHINAPMQSTSTPSRRSSVRIAEQRRSRSRCGPVVCHLPRPPTPPRSSPYPASVTKPNLIIVTNSDTYSQFRELYQELMLWSTKSDCSRRGRRSLILVLIDLADIAISDNKRRSVNSFLALLKPIWFTKLDALERIQIATTLWIWCGFMAKSPKTLTRLQTPRYDSQIQKMLIDMKTKILNVKQTGVRNNIQAEGTEMNEIRLLITTAIMWTNSDSDSVNYDYRVFRKNFDQCYSSEDMGSPRSEFETKYLGLKVVMSQELKRILNISKPSKTPVLLPITKSTKQTIAKKVHLEPTKETPRPKHTIPKVQPEPTKETPPRPKQTIQKKVLPEPTKQATLSPKQTFPKTVQPEPTKLIITKQAKSALADLTRSQALEIKKPAASASFITKIRALKDKTPTLTGVEDLFRPSECHVVPVCKVPLNPSNILTNISAQHIAKEKQKQFLEVLEVVAVPESRPNISIVVPKGNGSRVKLPVMQNPAISSWTSSCFNRPSRNGRGDQTDSSIDKLSSSIQRKETDVPSPCHQPNPTHKNRSDGDISLPASRPLAVATKFRRDTNSLIPIPSKLSAVEAAKERIKRTQISQVITVAEKSNPQKIKASEYLPGPNAKQPKVGTSSTTVFESDEINLDPLFLTIPDNVIETMLPKDYSVEEYTDLIFAPTFICQGIKIIDGTSHILLFHKKEDS